MNILLIEDNPGDAELMRELLREVPNCSFVVAEKLSQGLDLLGSQDFDVVLLDLGLPDSPGGLKTLIKVRSRFPNVAVVIMTGFKDDELGAQAVELGARDYLIKGDVDSSSLQRVLQHAVERKKTDLDLGGK